MNFNRQRAMIYTSKRNKSVKSAIYLFGGHTQRCTFFDDAVLNHNAHHNRIPWIEYKLR